MAADAKQTGKGKPSNWMRYRLTNANFTGEFEVSGSPFFGFGHDLKVTNQKLFHSDNPNIQTPNPKGGSRMNSVTINGRQYEIPEITFDAICELEESGVYLLNMDRKNPKIATMIRGLVAWITRLDPEDASKEIQAHIENGGNIMDILTGVTSALNSSGFFKRNGKQKVEGFPQNRQQRRHGNHKRNTDRSEN